jgi:hypothetical protein
MPARMERSVLEAHLPQGGALAERLGEALHLEHGASLGHRAES